MKNLIVNGKGMLFGIVGAIIGAFPNVFLKTYLAFSDFGWSFCNSFVLKIGWGLAITPCGIVSFVVSPLWEPLFLIIIGGALFGLIGMRLGYKNAQKPGHTSGLEDWRGSFWWSFFGGVLYDLIFMFMIIWPGQ